jgi:lipopolysaccharide/colanic/teichoic acid biosynthesis glycosyltransferase
MKIIRSTNNMPLKDSHENHSEIPYFSGDDDYGLYTEDYFGEMIRLERKRIERSKKAFCLMLLNIENILVIDTAHEALNNIASILFSVTRELDIKGWHKSNSIIGVIFTEIAQADINSAKESIERKIYHHFMNILGPGLSNEIEISFHFFPDEGHTHTQRQDNPLNINTLFYPEVPGSETRHRRKSLSVKRMLDIAGSILGLVIFAPFFLIIPILIKLTSQGPILFRQERIGQYGRRFTFLKFRSMHINNNDSIHRKYTEQLIRSAAGQNKAGGSEEGVYKLRNDPRITEIGRFLRKSSLDELPQFLNVLRGDMSLVGPRPPIPYEFSHYDTWHKYRLMQMKPGITGLWQITGRSSTTFDEMVRLDLKYARAWSPWLDIRIILKTPWVVLTGKGAY